MSKEYCIARQDDKMCFLPNCKYHISLIGNMKELLQKLDAFCFNCQHVDFVYTSSTASMAKLFSRVENSLIICRRQFVSTRKAEEWTECQASGKRDSWGKSTRNIWLSSIQKTKSTQTKGSVFADRIEQVQKTKFELGLIKVVDFFLDGHGNYTSNLVYFEIISL